MVHAEFLEARVRENVKEIATCDAQYRCLFLRTIGREVRILRGYYGLKSELPVELEAELILEGKL